MTAREAAALLALAVLAIAVGVAAGGYALTVARERAFLKLIDGEEVAPDEGP